MSIFGAVLPSLVLAVAMLLAGLPWGLSADWRLVPPVLVGALLFLFDVRRRDAVPEWGAFACGLALDVASQGPLGFWALLYLTVFVLAGLMRPPFRSAQDESLVREALLYFVAVCALPAAAWALASLYAFEWAAPWPYGLSTIVAALAFPAMAAIAGFVDLRGRQDRRVSLVSGDHT